MFELHHGDCLATLKTFDDNSVDSIVTDPPYGLSFMGKRWDYDVHSTEVWAECLRVLKPGGHLLAFAGTRTQHRMAVRIEDAGFEIRDMIAWVYGSGFPKSRNISADMEEGYNASVWQGWGTALKPALEPITVARKPLVGTVAANVMAHGTGALNIDGCRVAGEKAQRGERVTALGRMNDDAWKPKATMADDALGRWPANLIHDGGEFLGEQARFFYCAKASKSDRNEGCTHLDAKQYSHDGRETPTETAYQRNNSVAANNHPTVKPTDLMAYLCRLVTPPGGTVLDPFMGSGSTGKAAMREGFRFIGCELSPEYLTIARARIAHALWGDLA